VIRKFGLCVLFVVLLCAAATGAVAGAAGDAPDEQWNETFGGPSASEGQAAVGTGDGGVVVAGYATTADGDTDVQVQKVDSSGSRVWNHSYGGTGDEYAHAIATTDDGGYVVAGWTRPAGLHQGTDVWLAKLDGSGSLVWNRTYGGAASERAYSVLETADGGYALAGWTNSSGAGARDVRLRKVDSSGSTVFARTYGGAGADEGQALVQTADGGFAVAGWTNSSGSGGDDMWLVRTSNSGAKQWSETYGGSAGEGAYRHGLVQTADGGFALAGWTETYSIGFDDMWLVKVDATGTEQWNETYGRSLNDVATSVVQTADGGYTLAGYTRTYDGDSYDAWLVKTGSDGAEQWNVTTGGGGVDVGTDLVGSTERGYTVAGYTGSYGAGSYDTWLVKTVGDGPAPPTIDASSVDLSPYPVERGTDPTLSVTVRSADAVDVTVTLPERDASTTVEMTRTDGDQYRLDLSRVGLLDGVEAGTEVDLEVVATNDAGTARLGTFLAGGDRTRFLTTNADLDYYVFRDVKDVAVVVGTFAGQDRPDDLGDASAVGLWERSTELDVNNYLGSGRGSMGALGYDFTYLDNDSQFYSLPHEASYYGNRADPDWLYHNIDDCPNEPGSYTAGMRCGAHFVLRDLKSTSGLDASEYHSWIGTHGGASVGNPNDSEVIAGDENRFSGVHFSPGYGNDNGERIYSPIGPGVTTMVHELGHGTPMSFAHPTNKDERVSLMGYESQFGPDGEERIAPISSVHRLGRMRFDDASGSVDWLERNGTTMLAGQETTLEAQALRNYTLGEEVPVVSVPDGDGPTSSVDFVFEGNPDRFESVEALDDESVRMYRLRDGEVTRFRGPANSGVRTAKVGIETGLELEYETTTETGTGEDYRGTVRVEMTTGDADTNTVALASDVSVPRPYANGAGELNYTTPDLDLVAIDSQGRRVGVDSSGTYVNEIPGANASGDRNGLEWIAVPEDADVRFTVVSDDVETFVNETNVSEENVSVEFRTSLTHLGTNPEVVQEDGSYTVTNTTTTVDENRTVDPGNATEAVDGTVFAGFATRPDEPHPNRTVTFDGSLSTTLNGSVENYSWSLGDDATATGETVSHVFTQSGNYTVTLTVTDSADRTDTVSRTIRVADRPPVARLEVRATDPVAEQTPVTLSAANATDVVGITAYRWDFDGDGTVERVTNNSTATVTHTYATAGTYRPTVVVVDTKNQTARASRTLTVAAPDGGDGGSGWTGGGGGAGSAPAPTGSPGAAARQSSLTVDTAGPGTTFLVSRAEANATVSFAVPERASYPSEPAEFAAIDLTLGSPAESFRLDVGAPSDAPPGEVPALEAGSALTYQTVTPADDSASVESARLRLTVDREALPEGASPADVRIYHYHGGSWTALSTTHVENDTYVATTSAFSTFAVGVATQPPATATPTATPTTATPTATSATGPTATAPPTATPGTASSGSGPGFGVVVALLAVLGGVVLVRLRQD
jgi:PGF-CTERM protein